MEFRYKTNKSTQPPYRKNCLSQIDLSNLSSLLLLLYWGDKKGPRLSSTPEKKQHREVNLAETVSMKRDKKMDIL